jgi:hypothetical protein
MHPSFKGYYFLKTKGGGHVPQVLTFIPLPYLIFGPATLIVLLVILGVKGFRHFENKRATNEQLQAKVWDLEMRISWHQQNQKQKGPVREVVYVEAPRQSVGSNKDNIMTKTTDNTAALVRSDTKADDVKDLQEELYRDEEDLERGHQLEMPIGEDEQQSMGPFIFSPPKMTLMEVAKEPDAIFLKQAGITASPVNIQEENDNVVLFPVKPAIHEEFFQNFEQVQFEFELTESKLQRGEGLYWGHYKILDRYDSSMATCLNVARDSKQVLQHNLLGSLEQGDIFTALVQIRNKSSYVLGMYPGQHSLNSGCLADEEMVS